MRFCYRNGYLSADVPSVYPAPPTFPDLTLTALLNWPGIKTTINLDHLKFSREIKPNCERELVFGNDHRIGMSTQHNQMQTRYIQKVPTTRTYPLVSKDILDAYISALVTAAPQYKVGPQKLSEIEHALQQILDDIASVPFASMQSRVPHSRFLNEQKYYSVFESPIKERTGKIEVRLREIVNPEVNFEIEKCGFPMDSMDEWQEKVLKYLEDVLIAPSGRAQDILNERFKKCLVMKCEKCNETFEGALLNVTLKNHIKQKHFVDKQWTCVKCDETWDEYEMLNMQWKHECRHV